MSRLPAVTGKRVVKALMRFGFEKRRQVGSHVFMQHADGRATVVPLPAKRSAEASCRRYFATPS